QPDRSTTSSEVTAGAALVHPSESIRNCLRLSPRAAIVIFGLVAAASCDQSPVGPERIRDKIELKPATRDFVPSAIPTPMVAAIWYHTCALKNDGLVVCWGDNDYGQSTVPAGLNGVIHVAGGEFHSCALKSDGTVACWGSNSS